MENLNVESKNEKFKIWKLFLGLSICWAFIYLGLLGTERTSGLKLLVNLFNFKIQKVHLTIISLLIILAWIVFLLIKLWRRAKKNWQYNLIGISSILLALLGIGTIYLFILGTPDTIYHEFKSPDKKYNLVTEEYTQFFTAYVQLYERQNSFFIEEIEGGYMGTPDLYTPITYGNYWIKWENDTVTISCDVRASDDSWTTISIDYGDGKPKAEYLERWYPSK